MKSLLLTLIVVSCLWAEQDTSYSRFRAKSKSSAESNSTSSTSSDDEDENSGSSSIFGAILHAIFSKDDDDDYHTSSYSEYDSNDKSSQDISAFTSKNNSEEYDSFMLRSVYGSVGLGGAYHDYATHGQGGVFSIPVGIYWFSPLSVTLRLSATPGWGGYTPEVDYVQDRYINGSKNGTRTFVTDHATTFQIPLVGDLLVAPGNQEVFNIILGGGVNYRKEKMSGIWNETTLTETIVDNSWEPVVHGGLGLMAPTARGALFLEVNMKVFFHDNEGIHPTLSDNSASSFQFGGALSILF